MQQTNNYSGVFSSSKKRSKTTALIQQEERGNDLIFVMKETFLGTSCETGEPGKRKQGLMSCILTKKVGPVMKIFHPKYPVSLQMETE